MTDLTIADFLLKLVKEWRSLTKPRQADLLRLCHQKYRELEETHMAFTKTVLDIKDIVERAQRLGEKNNEDPVVQLELIERERLEGRQTRLSRYEQASLYASETFADRSSLLKTVPQPIVDSVQTMMESYVDYFRQEGMYNHELGHLIFNISVYFSRREIKTDSARFRKMDAQHAVAMIESTLSTFELGWMHFSRDYYRAYATFADHGIFGESTTA